MSIIDRAGWRGYIALSLVWLAVLAGALLLTRRPAAQPIEIIPPPTSAPTAAPLPTATPEPTATPRPLRVDVIGAVVHPMVYTLPPGSIVADAIAAAGGPSPDADTDRVNRAMELQDGMQVYVPHVAETPSLPLMSTAPAIAAAPAQSEGVAETGPRVAPARAAPTLALGGQRINVNTATLAELETLPGIGPKTAALIVNNRPYGHVDDLLRVKGIGPATLAKLKDLVVVE
jgi:competence protein ComEA